jgi:hypothetical protein
MNRTKVVIPFEDGEWHGKTAETIWVKKLNNNLYKVDNIPFLAYGISFGDIIDCVEIDGRLVINSIITKSKYTTLRISFEDNVPFDSRKEYVSLISQYGELEYYDNMELYAFDTNDKSELNKVLTLLKELESKNILSYEEANFGT